MSHGLQSITLAPAPPHCLHRLFRGLCWQMEAPPHSTHWLFWRWCSQRPPPPHCLHWLFRRLCWQMEPPPRSTHWLFRRWCSLRPEPPHCSPAPVSVVLADGAAPAMLTPALQALVLAERALAPLTGRRCAQTRSRGFRRLCACARPVPGSVPPPAPPSPPRRPGAPRSRAPRRPRDADVRH